MLNLKRPATTNGVQSSPRTSASQAKTLRRSGIAQFGKDGSLMSQSSEKYSLPRSEEARKYFRTVRCCCDVVVCASYPLPPSTTTRSTTSRSGRSIEATSA